MWQKFSDEQSALIIHSHPPSQFTPLLSKNKKENITKFRQKYSFNSVLLKARQVLKLALSENIKLHTPVPKETTQHGWPIYYPWHTSGDQTGVKSYCFEIEILVTLENYFMAGEKECGCLCSVSDVYELALKPPLRENFTYAHRLQLRIIVVIVWPRLWIIHKLLLKPENFIHAYRL